MGACIEASSVPELGKLYPLSANLNVDPATGKVGIGTTGPAQRLHVHEPGTAIAILGEASAASGAATGVHGSSSSSSGFGVRGQAMSGTATGVQGDGHVGVRGMSGSTSPLATGVIGTWFNFSAPPVDAAGVRGGISSISGGPNGAGVLGTHGIDRKSVV